MPSRTVSSYWKLPVLESHLVSSAKALPKRQTDVLVTWQESSKGEIKKLVVPAGAYAEVADRCRKDDTFAGRAKTAQYFRFGGADGAKDALFVGLGNPGELTEEKTRQAGGVAWSKLLAEKCRSAVIDLDSLCSAHGLKAGLEEKRLARAFAEGFILGAYQFRKYHTSPQGDYAQPEKLHFVTSDRAFAQDLKEILAQVRAVGESVNVARDWSNEPSNFGTPEYYAREAQRLARLHGLKCRVLTEQDALREKMGLFLAVGAGSDREGRVVVLEYVPKGKARKTVALVGKGVTFDSGGISIKPSTRMEDMKHDMAGAATLFAATLLAAKWKVPNRVVTVLAFTENMPDGKATQPGNVIRARNGKTVEIINTDAEGRLVLADVLDYAHEFKPDVVVDAATLTGAVGVALGKHCCAILGNDDGLIETLRRAGDACGERLWQLPLFDEYFEDIRSDYADMKNSANDTSGGTIRGAMFLKQFIRKGTRWAHLDIASTAYNVTHSPYLPKKGASGMFVRTLAQFVADF